MAAERREIPAETQVVVIGAGILGTMTAYFLAKRGVPVVLCEKGRVAGEQSSRNWGFVRKQLRDPRELPAIIESSRIWGGLQAEVGEDLGWHQGGSLYVAKTDRDLAWYEYWLEQAGGYQLDTRLLSPAEVDGFLGIEGREFKGALYTASDGRAEPSKAVPAIARAVERSGGVVLESCAVRTVETAVGAVRGVVTEHGPIACQSVVCAGGAWTSLFSGNLGHAFPQLKIRGSVMRTTPAPLLSESNINISGLGLRRRQDGGYTIARSGSGIFDIVPDALRWFRFYGDARKAEPGIKLRLGKRFWRELRRPRRWRADEVTPFEETRVLDPEPDHGALNLALAEARRRFPVLGDLRMREAWAGMIDVTPDAVPVLSGVDGLAGYYVAAGLSGHGFGMGPAAGMIMADMVMGRPPMVDIHPFRLSRFSDGSPIEVFAKALWRPAA